MVSLSIDTQTLLLLTAPLLVGGENTSAAPLRRAEYRRVQNHLARISREPADLVGSDADHLIKELNGTIEDERLRRLLGRGFELTQAIERWHSRSLWVVSFADADYPQRFKDRMGERAPLLLYGCGDIKLTETKCFGVVGSRDIDESLIQYTEKVGSLAARSGFTIVSGGARGVDQAAMRGSIDSGGKVVGILAESLERTSVDRENRDLITEGRVLLLSVHDPSAGFSIGNAMQRNKLIYALSAAALVVNSDYETGGTWAGATEQLEKYRYATVYVRDDAASKGLTALQLKGATPWPEPTDEEQFVPLMSSSPTSGEVKQLSLLEL
jgi:DNA processing protein